MTRCSAFFAAMKANLIGSASRRTPLLYLESLRFHPDLRGDDLTDVATQLLQPSEVVALRLGGIHAIEVVGPEILKGDFLAQHVIGDHESAMGDRDRSPFRPTPLD